jgi:hypothetical protein
MSNIFNNCHNGLGGTIIRSLGQVGKILRVNIIDSDTTEVYLATYLIFRKIRIKQSNNIMGFNRNQPLHGGL